KVRLKPDTTYYLETEPAPLAADVVPMRSLANIFRAKHRQLPCVGALIVAHEIRMAFRVSQFEVPVVGRQPRVDDLRDGDATLSKNQRTRRLFAAVAGVALDTNTEERFFMHPRSSACRPSAALAGLGACSIGSARRRRLPSRSEPAPRADSRAANAQADRACSRGGRRPR